MRAVNERELKMKKLLVLLFVAGIFISKLASAQGTTAPTQPVSHTWQLHPAASAVALLKRLFSAVLEMMRHPAPLPQGALVAAFLSMPPLILDSAV